MSLRNNKAFTLVELVIAAAIISTLIISALVYVNPLEQFRKIRDAQRIEEIRRIKSALERYFIEEESYPGFNNVYKATTALSSSIDSNVGGWIIEGREIGNEYLGFDISGILTKIYIDPNIGEVAAGVDKEGNKRILHYIFRTDGVGGFALGALKESGNNMEIIEIGTAFNLITPEDFPIK